MGPLRALASSDTVLSRRSRIGDRGAAQRLAARHLDRVTELATIVTGDSERATSLARQGFALALRGRRPFDDALVHAFARLAATTPDPDAARGRLLVLLVEVEHRPVAEAATLLGLGPDTASAMLPPARVLAGLPALAFHCRGWGLVSRRGLTGAEQDAGSGHAALCHRCRDRLAELERTRAQLLGGTAGLATGLAAAQLLAAGGSAAVGAGAGGVLATKAIAGLVAAAAGTVLVAGGTAAVLQQPPHDAGYSPAPAGSEPAPRSPGGAAPSGPTTAPLLPGVTVPVEVPPVPIPAASVPALPLPTDLPTSLPTLPVPLPTLPVPLPTLPVPVPTVPATLPSLPTLP